MSSRTERDNETTSLLRQQVQQPALNYSRNNTDYNSHSEHQQEQDQNPENDPPSSSSPPPSFTFKALLTGLLLGTLLCHLNIYLGLLNGFSDPLSQETVLLGFVILQSSKFLFGTTFSAAENVLISTVAGTMGMMPSVAGVVSSLVAAERLVPSSATLMKEEGRGKGWELDGGGTALWGVGVGLFALPLIMLFRRYFVDEADLPWPSAKAAGMLVKVIHGTSEKLTGREAVKRLAEDDAPDGREDGADGEEASSDIPEVAKPEIDLGPRILLWSFAVASILVSSPRSGLRKKDRD
jgi:uncharacterized oligopeptide transporter (OPT) family protein